jgi:hypothetical protein
MSSQSSAKYLYAATAAVAIGLVVFAVVKNSTPSLYDEFAQCLTDNGVKMYGTWWCSHCQNQKELFGNSFEKINYIECSNKAREIKQECKDAGVEGFPTWQFVDGSLASGEQSLESLAEKSGCALPEGL